MVNSCIRLLQDIEQVRYQHSELLSGHLYKVGDGTKSMNRWPLSLGTAGETLGNFGLTDQHHCQDHRKRPLRQRAVTGLDIFILHVCVREGRNEFVLENSVKFTELGQ